MKIFKQEFLSASWYIGIVFFGAFALEYDFGAGFCAELLFTALFFMLYALCTAFFEVRKKAMFFTKK